jgi:signal peptidase I
MAKTIFIILILILAIGAFLFNALILNFITKLFKVENAKYKTALKISLFIIIFSALTNIVIEIILNFTNLKNLNNILSIIVGGYVTYKLLSKYYGISLKKSLLIYITNLLISVIIALLIIIPLRYFVIQPFYVKGAAMEPTFFDNDYLLINEISYRFKKPERGDVVIFRYPENPSQYFLKRIVGLPEEKIQIKNGDVYIYNTQNPNSFKLNETYLQPETKTYTENEEIVNLRNDEYYVLGDNRKTSNDSRKFGPVNNNFFIGKFWFAPLK